MCIGLISKYLKNLSIKSVKKYEKKRKILASEVSGKQVLKTNFDEIKEKIEERENESKLKPTKKIVQELIDLYQKAIEYLSTASNDSTSSDQINNYLLKMTSMFKDENFTKLLNEPDPIEEIIIK